MGKIDWRLPNSEDEKANILAKVGLKWGDKITTHIWYYFFDCGRLSKKEEQKIADKVFVEKEPVSGLKSSGDMDIHMIGSQDRDVCIRFRGQIILKPSVELPGFGYCPLFRVGTLYDQRKPSHMNFSGLIGMDSKKLLTVLIFHDGELCGALQANSPRALAREDVVWEPPFLSTEATDMLKFNKSMNLQRLSQLTQKEMNEWPISSQKVVQEVVDFCRMLGIKIP